jgi:hypothetical protein
MLVMVVEGIPSLTHHGTQNVREQRISQGPRLGHDAPAVDVIVQQYRVRPYKVGDERPLKNCSKPIKMQKEKYHIRNANREEYQNVCEKDHVRPMSYDITGPDYVRLKYICVDPRREVRMVPGGEHYGLKACTGWIRERRQVVQGLDVASQIFSFMVGLLRAWLQWTSILEKITED